MRKKIFRIAAVAVAMSLLFANTAFATITSTVKTSGTYKDDVVVDYPQTVDANGSTIDITIEGNAKNTGDNFCVWAQNGATVHVTKDVEGLGDGTVLRCSASTVTVDGTVISHSNTYNAIRADKGAIVTAGSVEAVAIGVDAQGTGTAVNVTGLVKSTGTGASDAGIKASKGAVVIAGSVDAANDGVKVSGDSVVVVNGDVDATNCAININNGTDKGGMVTVLGTVDGKFGVGVADPEDETYSVYAYEINAEDGRKLFVNSMGFQKDSVKDHVFYIVKTSGVGDIASLTDKNNNQYTTTVDGKTYYGVKASDAKGTEIRPSAQEISEGNGYIVRVTEVPGYKFKSMTTDNAKAVLTMNDDGTYTLIVPEGGGVTLDLVYEAIRKSSGSFTSTPTSMGSASAPLTGGTWTNVNGVWTYTNNGEKLINTTAWIQYTNAQGQVVTAKFCFDNNGNMITNAWKQTADGVWNYFGADGAMLVNTTTPDGYVVDANGNWVKAQ